MVERISAIFAKSWTIAKYLMKEHEDDVGSRGMSNGKPQWRRPKRGKTKKMPGSRGRNRVVRDIPELRKEKDQDR